MKRTLSFLISGACVLALAPSAQAGEKALSEKQMPAPVLASFHRAYPNATIKSLAKETEKGKTTFEVESLDGKTRRDLSYLADGTLVEMEETILEADLPAAVMIAMKAKYPKATIQHIEKDTQGTAVTYELHVKEGRSPMEIVFSPEGKVLNEEKGGND